ncbi:tetratricopeptide repeat protein [Pirellula sp. SH-Sr6A]|uniref:tetratricopeptide repeat protein n=1 Tax=Pirellula sp. SH-Sr6A TaxID=1632865 RepID=UPI00143919EA|nr:tetratricopeptide repeat protein [Pirellula sp. SH-Sr6A]
MKTLLGAVAVLVLTSFAALGVYLYAFPEPAPTEQLDLALRLLSKGEIDVAARLASVVEDADLVKNSDHSKKLFLLGARERNLARSIEQRPVAMERNEKAVEYLTKSRSYSFPDGFEGLANYHLGMALFDLFRWDEAEEPLAIASARWPAGRSDAIERLVDIDLSRDRQDIENALDRISHWRTLPRSSADDDERADIKEMQAYFAAGEFEKVDALQARIPKNSNYRPLSDLFAGKCEMELSKRENSPEGRTKRLEKALEYLAAVLKSPKTTISVRRQANLDQGKVTRSLGRLTEAISILSILRLSSPYEPESLAAGIEEIETLIQADRVDDAIDTMVQVSNNLGDLRWYYTDWLPISGLRDRVTAACQTLIDMGRYPQAQKFVSSLPKFCDMLDRIRLESSLYEKWAESLPKGGSNDRDRLEHYRSAGKAYEDLTRQLPRAKEYDDWLWSSIENYRKSGDYLSSNRMLDRYISLQDRANRPKGYFVRAKNLASMEKSDDAMKSLQQILASNIDTPLIYDARLELAKLKRQQDAFDEAQDLMLENLSGELRPESPIWRESLFELALMLFSRGERGLLKARNEIEANPSKMQDFLGQVEASQEQLLESIRRIEEFLRRYPTDVRRFQFLYQMAQGYQHASFWPEIQLRESKIASEERLASLKSQKKELLVQARKAYSRLRQEILADRDASRALVSNLDDLLRNSFFGEADLYFNDEEYEEALIAYTDAANRFINEPESLEARKQIALCQRKLGRLADCRRSLELARDSLQRIPAEQDAKFKAVTPHDRAGWERYLTALIQDLDRENTP